jgi:hypothetical protein
MPHFQKGSARTAMAGMLWLLWRWQKGSWSAETVIDKGNKGISSFLNDSVAVFEERSCQASSIVSRKHHINWMDAYLG